MNAKYENSRRLRKQRVFLKTTVDIIASVQVSFWNRWKLTVKAKTMKDGACNWSTTRKIELHQLKLKGRYLPLRQLRSYIRNHKQT